MGRTVASGRRDFGTFDEVSLTRDEPLQLYCICTVLIRILLRDCLSALPELTALLPKSITRQAFRRIGLGSSQPMLQRKTKSTPMLNRGRRRVKHPVNQ